MSAFDRAEMIKRKKPWSHKRQCAYCQEQGYAPDSKAGGCRHYRGGKTITKRVVR